MGFDAPAAAENNLNRAPRGLNRLGLIAAAPVRSVETVRRPSIKCC
jgi:hypothetical protein